ncbi:MAG: carbohydrate binding domain-containing protein [Spirochaetes bacterium]|nr:carbohydrate binding domain-containing protein [Spirochaetota bacterium]
MKHHSLPAALAILAAVVVALSPTAFPAVPAAYWNFDEGTGDTVKDVGPNGYAGKISGAAEWVDGKFGKALRFNGVDSHVTCGPTAALNFTSDFTIMFWLKTAKAGSDKNPYSGVLGKFMYGAGGKGINRYDIIMHNSGMLRTAIRGEKNIDTGTIGPNLLDDTWHHVAVAVTKSSVKLYVDGTLVKDTPGEWQPNANEAPLTIGYRDGGMPAFNGCIDEVKLYDAALSAADIKSQTRAALPSGEGTGDMQKTASANLLQNAGFEESSELTGWTLNNWAKNEVEGGIDTMNPHSGKQCMRITMSKINNSPNLQFQQKVAVKPGMGMELRFWMRGRPNSKPINIQFRKMGAPYTTFYQVDAALSQEWREYVYTVMLPPKTDPEDTALYFNLNEENTYWLDDIQVTLVPPKDTRPPLIGNQVLNGSFEVGIDKWCATFREWGTSGDVSDESNSTAMLTSVAAADAPHGKRALSVPVRGGCQVALNSGYFPLRYGHPAKAGIWVKAPAIGKKFSFRIIHGLFPNLTVVGEKNGVSTKNDWEYHSFSFTPGLSSSKSYFFEFFCADPGEYLIDAVTVGEGDVTSAPNPFNAGHTAVDPRPANIYFKGDRIDFSVNLESADRKPAQKLYGRIINAWEQTVKKFTLDIPLAADGTGSVAVTFPSDTYGGFKCELFTDKNTDALPATEIMFSVVPKLKSPKESTDQFFGGHVRFTPHNLAIAKLMGFRSLRLHPPITTKWMNIAKFGYFTDGVARAYDMGFRLLGNFDTVPPEFADAPAGMPKEKYSAWYNSFGPKEPEPWKKYVKDTYKVFGPFIKEWEVWNEPDGGFLQVKPGLEKERVYTNIVRLTREALDEVNADAKIVGGVVAGLSRNFLEKALGYGMNKDIDIASYHCYYEDASPEEPVVRPSAIERSKKMQAMVNRKGEPLEVWHTEGGMWLSEGVSWIRTMRIPSASTLGMKDAANTIVRSAASLKAAGVKRHFHYADYVHQSGHTVNRLECSSTFDVNGMANPAVAAHAVCVMFLEDAEGTGLDEIRAGDAKVAVAHFKKNGKNIDVVWSRIPAAFADVPQVKTAGKKMFDMMGNPVTVENTPMITLNPVYVTE